MGSVGFSLVRNIFNNMILLMGFLYLAYSWHLLSYISGFLLCFLLNIFPMLSAAFTPSYFYPLDCLLPLPTPYNIKSVHSTTISTLVPKLWTVYPFFYRPRCHTAACWDSDYCFPLCICWFMTICCQIYWQSLTREINILINPSPAIICCRPNQRNMESSHD